MIAIFFKVKEKLREIFMSNFYSVMRFTFLMDFFKMNIFSETTYFTNYKNNKLFLFNNNYYFHIIKTFSCQVQVRVENR